MKDMKVGIIGGGTVGKATFRVFNEFVKDCCVYDRVLERRTDHLVYVLASDIVFVCLPETEVDSFFASLTVGTSLTTNFVLKSTVPIGFTKRMSVKYSTPNLVHSPEFLTERCALTDAQMPARNIVGLTGNGFNAPSLRALYGWRFPGTPLLTMSSDESEAVKLMTNAFFSTKVAFFNEMRMLADRLGLDWDTVHDGILGDGRIAHSHTLVPGPDGKHGFGGKCLPKDLLALMGCMGEAKLDHPLLVAANYRNIAIDRESS